MPGTTGYIPGRRFYPSEVPQPRQVLPIEKIAGFDSVSNSSSPPASFWEFRAIGKGGAGGLSSLEKEESPLASRSSIT
jgi:hypothetical protein